MSQTDARGNLWKILSHPVVTEFLESHVAGEPQEFVATILNAMIHPIFIKDESFRFVLFNDAVCDFLGIEAGDLIGKNDYDFFHEEEADFFRAKDRQVFETMESVSTEEPLTDAQGNTRWLLTTKSPFLLPSGQRLLVGIIQDITHRKLYERTLKQRWEEAMVASQTKDMFLAKMSHEFRTPLNAIVGYSEMLLEEGLGPQQNQDVSRILTSASHLLSLVNNLLELSHLKNKELTLHPARCDVKGLLSELLDIVGPMAQDQGNTLRLESGTQPLWWVTDHVKVRQILLNLLTNAIKHTAQGHITLRVGGEASAPEGLRIEVEDTGPGIAPDEIEHIFEPFMQVSHTGTRHGVGLGLAISRRLADALGGRLHVKSTVGQGSTFALEIPAGAQTPSG